jgi:uncharacterized membrane protein
LQAFCTLATDRIAQLISPTPNLLNITEAFPVKRRLTGTIFTNFESYPINRKIDQKKKMYVDPKQQLDKTKIIGFRVTEEELHNTIYPVMHDCYELGIIDHDTLTSFLRFCVQFWMGHYRMKKKQQFDMSQREIEE